MRWNRDEDERLANKRAAAAISSAADGEGDDTEALGPGVEGSKKQRTLLEASKELKKATANMDAGMVRQMKAKEEEHRMLREANQVPHFFCVDNVGGRQSTPRREGDGCCRCCCCRMNMSARKEGSIRVLRERQQRGLRAFVCLSLVVWC